MATKLDNLFQFHQNALNLHAFRQKAIASNIANADTPGYRARDIDFQAALKDAQSAQSGKPQAAQLKSQSDDATPFGTQLLYRSAVQRSADGNTVDIDVERAQFAENSVRYEAQIMFINSKIKSMLSAIQG